MQHNPHDRTEHNGNALFKMWRSWEDGWLSIPSKERLDVLHITVEQDFIEGKRQDLRIRWAIWLTLFIVPMMLGFTGVAITAGAVGIACEVYVMCVEEDAYHPAGGADQFGVLGWMFLMGFSVLAYLLVVGLIVSLINEPKITLIVLASLVGLVGFVKMQDAASDWGCERLQKLYAYLER